MKRLWMVCAIIVFASAAQQCFALDYKGITGGMTQDEVEARLAQNGVKIQRNLAFGDLAFDDTFEGEKVQVVLAFTRISKLLVELDVMSNTFPEKVKNDLDSKLGPSVKARDLGGECDVWTNRQPAAKDFTTAKMRAGFLSFSSERLVRTLEKEDDEVMKKFNPGR